MELCLEPQLFWSLILKLLKYYDEYILKVKSVFGNQRGKQDRGRAEKQNEKSIFTQDGA